jgi:hypothetical protein
MESTDSKPEIVLPEHLEARGDREAARDVLVTDYRTILAELTLLTTVSALLFGFLLTSRADFADTTLEEGVYALATVLVASATLVFVLPVAYHHVQFPYEDFTKFQQRSHRWIQVGTPILATGLYLSLCLAIWSLFHAWALLIASLPIIAATVVFVLRKGQL